MSRFEFDGFLKARNIYDHAYDVADFEKDLATLERMKTAGLLPRQCRRR